MLVVRGLGKTFPPVHRGGAPTIALDGVDLEAPTGAFVSVLGASGSGKTTLLRCIAGFERPDSGVITLDGRELVAPGTFVRPHARGVGVVPQEGTLFPHLTAAQNIAFGLVGTPRPRRHERVAELLDLVGLPGLGERRPDQLSGGQQQRVALARALAPEPRLILLDEPYTALDARLRVALREEVRGLLRRVGTTALLVTHDQGEAMSLADHLVVLRAGRVIARGTPREVYDRPADIELGRFLGEALVLPGEVRSAAGGVHVRCALGCLAVAQWHGRQGRCQVLIRPEQITARRPGPTAGPEVVLGVVEGQSYFGHDALVHIAVPGVTGPIAVRIPGQERFRSGDAAAVSVVAAVSTYPDGDSSSS